MTKNTLSKVTLTIMHAWPTPYPALTEYTWNMCQILKRTGYYQLDAHCTVKEWELASALAAMKIVVVDDHDKVTLDPDYQQILLIFLQDHARQL